MKADIELTLLNYAIATAVATEYTPATATRSEIWSNSEARSRFSTAFLHPAEKGLPARATGVASDPATLWIVLRVEPKQDRLTITAASVRGNNLGPDIGVPLSC
jgi:hypothetical protein